jgi:hypothetical protein
MAMVISSRQTPGSRVEFFERKDKMRLLCKMPSVMARRQSSPGEMPSSFSGFLSNQTSWMRFSRSA